MGILGIVFLSQAGIIIIVVAVLKAILGKNLTEMAVRRLELWEEGPVPERVRIVSQGPLALRYRTRIQAAVAKRIGPQVPCRFDREAGLWGGVRLEVGQQVVNFTVRDRLRQAFGR